MGKKIFIVDDEPDILDFCKLVLETEGFEIQTASNGLDLIKELPSFKPDLILLDVMMPDMDGWEVLRMLNNDDRYDKIPIAMLTAKTQAKDKILGIQEGAIDYITKPFAPDELLERIEKIFSHIDTDK
ncbi:MAG: response regulator [bacterium]|nr:response regulator [bacterium]